MKVLLIGGTGYIGSALYLWLKNKFEVEIIDLEWFGNYVHAANNPSDYRNLSKTYLKTFDAIVLLAGHSSVQMCLNNRASSFANNITNFIELLDKIDGQKFIYASSSSVYGCKKEASEEDTTYSPQNYYDLSKKIIDYYALLSSIDYYGLRFGTVNGSSPNLRIDLMLNKMHHSAKESGVVVVTNPSISRPILGIKDVCRAIETILVSPSRPGIYNLASCNATVMEMAAAVAEATKASIDVQVGPISYDFSIDTRKFKKAFDFTFSDTINTLINDLHENQCLSNTRGRPVYYV